MNNVLSGIVVLLLTATTALFAQSESKEQLVVPLTDPGKPGSLEVGLVNGFIHVTGYSGKDVIIDASTRSSSRAEDRSTSSGGMRRISTNNALDVSAEEKNNRIRINATSHQKPVNLTIRVPQRFSLKISTVNEGDITVERVSGELEINNVNGAIELTNISGSAVANTINGDVTAVFRDVSPNAPMAFSTLNGRVDVTFPASVKANVKLKSDRGDIFSDFDFDIDKSQPKGTRSTKSGMYRVSIEDWVYGRINNGGPEVMMKTMQGSIYVRKAK
ncbi:DUF4097 family beta strand repeat-containing protein [Spirosoma rigui]|uniref:DUF4097 family beta strand repeat-containing protein n=1 Tax=Spirosoma rigui TaxID=564064 RepID=UPI0009AFA11C|nr:DUF4097 family beta strand repeat-containing protein [Spirosoma rigui]